jgi:hypothetical protein
VADFPAYELIVAGENFYAHAMLPESRNRRTGALFGRIEKRDVPLEHEIGFIIF